MTKIVSTTKRLLQSSLNICRKHISDILGEVRLPLPTTLNLFVNEICNSRCKMCNIWRRKQEKVLTPSELSTILDNSLFTGLEYVGVSGGEPTLRKDLPEIFRIIVRKNGIKGTGIITNAIKTDLVIDQIDKCNSICNEANVPFNVMVSLDGIGKIHDTVRGRQGNYESALKVIRHVRDNTDIPLTVACTVVKENVWHLNEVLEFCQDEDVYGRFRVAEYINRLNNEYLKSSIQNFNADERYEIALFFSKLELAYEKSQNIRETYKNIRQMVFEGKSRQSGCPYQTTAICLDSKGNLLFCSPKSPILGSCLEKSAKTIYKSNIQLRDSILENFCSNCVHDYHSPPTKESLKEREKKTYFTKRMSVQESLDGSALVSTPSLASSDWSQFKAPLIIGWYGTETIGDKAILGGIILKLKQMNPQAQITIASLYPFITKRTLYELGTKDIKIIKTYSATYMETCSSADAVIMGGGPLMGMEPLGFVLAAFTEARRNSTPTIVKGCGIGPLKNDKHILAVKEILRLSTEITVRDTASLFWVGENTGRTDAVCTGDPAVGYVQDWKKKNILDKPLNNENCFACFLREITTEYSGGITPNGFAGFQSRFEEELGRMIRYVQGKTGLKPIFMPMHTFIIGKDDRDFARRFAKAYLENGSYEIGYKVYSPHDTLLVMSNVRFNICMRFHSVLFAETIGVPFIAIDYTNGGKIKGFLQDKGKEDLKINRVDIVKGDWKKKLDNIFLNDDFAEFLSKPNQ